MSYYSWYKLSRERRSDAIAERRLSHGSRRANSTILAKNGEHFGKKIPSKKEPLANACFFWLAMLYYKHSRLNGRGCPLGIETPNQTASSSRSSWLNGRGCPLVIEAYT